MCPVFASSSSYYVFLRSTRRLPRPPRTSLREEVVVRRRSQVERGLDGSELVVLGVFCGADGVGPVLGAHALQELTSVDLVDEDVGQCFEVVLEALARFGVAFFSPKGGVSVEVDVARVELRHDLRLGVEGAQGVVVVELRRHHRLLEEVRHVRKRFSLAASGVGIYPLLSERGDDCGGVLDFAVLLRRELLVDDFRDLQLRRHQIDPHSPAQHV
mmetsp:Transcript_11123/g.33336  ORF Transcript_11123/g.33336 Transcript_11123/m.33336 type:complete len:215 (-) Transcript_11123:1283-1927(-)